MTAPGAKSPRVKATRRLASQLSLEFRTWGGKRAGAGRKSRDGRKHMPHRARSTHDKNHPVHVTLRAVKALPSLRKQTVYVAVRGALADTWREWFRVIHFSVQSDHVHLIVEADDTITLSRGMAGLTIRLARAVNRAAGRKGKVFSERYHTRELSTPRETRNAIVYVLLNRRKHAAKTGSAMGFAGLAGSAGSVGVAGSAGVAGSVGVAGSAGIDPMSSGYWFDGWKAPSGDRYPPGWVADDAVPVRPARTWLARKGWRRHGLIANDERPKVS